MNNKKDTEVNEKLSCGCDAYIHSLPFYTGCPRMIMKMLGIRGLRNDYYKVEDKKNNKG